MEEKADLQPGKRGGWACYLGDRWELARCFIAGLTGRHSHQRAFLHISCFKGELLQIDSALAEGMLLVLP